MKLLDGNTYRDADGREQWIVGDTRGHNSDSVWSVQGNHYDRATGRMYTYTAARGRELLPADSHCTLVDHLGVTP
jgi:hypothetical protein